MKKKTSKKPVATQPKSRVTPAVAPPAPVVSPKPEKVLVLRTCAKDMTSYNGFVWPSSGPVECPDWIPTATCGNGLHGLAWGDGDWTLLSDQHDAVWMAVEVAASDIVKIDASKVKFPRGTVVYAGSKGAAMARVLAGVEAMSEAQRAAREWGEKSGNSSKAASSGDSSTAASSGDYSKAASSGDYSKAASSGDYSKAASSGDYGIAATIGTGGFAKAGPLGLVIVTYWSADDKRYRACVGNVGEDGILADTWYRVVDAKLVAVST